MSNETGVVARSSFKLAIALASVLLIVPVAQASDTQQTPYAFFPLFAANDTSTSCLSQTRRAATPGSARSLKPYVATFLRQSDGGMILGGRFAKVKTDWNEQSWTERNGVLRMNPDGSWDSSWHLDIQCDDGQKDVSLSALASDSAGNIYVGGLFVTPGSDGRRNLARFNAKGELDADWRVDADGEILALAVDEDGDLFVAGAFTQIGGLQRSYLAKIHDGKVAEEWDPAILAPVRALTIAGASIFAGGDAMVSSGAAIGSPASSLAKLVRAGNGVADPAWKAPVFDQGRGGVYSVVLDHRGFLYAGGDFGSVGNSTRQNIARFSASDGELDKNWMAGQSDGFRSRLQFQGIRYPIPVQAIVVDGEDNVFVGGSFDRSSYVPTGSAKNALAKIDAQGNFDNTWGNDANSSIDFVTNLLVEGEHLNVGGQLGNYSGTYALARGLPVATMNANQRGLSGSWGRMGTPGTRQGFLFNVYPDNIAPGHGTIFAGWYTYDVVGGSGGQRWYALQGDVYTNNNVAILDICTATDGNLAAGQSPTCTKVGSAKLIFNSCSTGNLIYMFDDGRFGGFGTIQLSRVTQNTTCGIRGDNGSDPANALLGGTWIVPGVPGMGFVIDISPADKVLLGSWYTFFPADYAAPSPRQQWFVFQDSNFGPAATASNDIDLLQSGGGTFDATVGGGVTTDTVGKVSLSFQSCTAATFTYTIWPNKLNTQSVSEKTVSLVRLGPAPAGCAL